MLDINLIRHETAEVKRQIAKRGIEVDFTNFLAQDEKRREIIFEVEQMKAKRNQVSGEIPQLKKAGQDISELLAEMKLLSTKIKDLDDELSKLEAEQNDFLISLPNIPAEHVQAGGKEANQVEQVFGKKPEFDFKPRHHVDISVDLGLIDYERGVKMGGHGYWLYRGDGARLEWALLNYFMDSHLADNYELVLPPHILNRQCGYASGQFPKFEDDVFQIKAEGSDFEHFLLPTSETALINMFRDEILSEDDLPIRLFSYTPCYRKEAGSYRAEERGMIRGHQFNKVEMFQYTLPEESTRALSELVNKAAKLVEGLGLHFRVSKLAAADVSASMCETKDIEIWIPSMNDYKEVSSASSAGDYQTRRGKIRFKRNSTGKVEFVHSLNASGLATSRVFPAILEQNQRADGSVYIPKVLQKYMGNQEYLRGLKSL